LTASSGKDRSKSKQGGSKGGVKDSKSVICSGCGGTYHSLDKCFFKEHPDFNKSGTWEKSAALAKLKAKIPDDESRHRLDRKSRINDTPLEKKSEKPKGKKGTKVPLDNDAPTTHVVAAAEAAADNTMYRDCVITTHASNCRVVKVLFDTGSTPFNFVREEIADCIEAANEGK
jgi:hypothetical protein